MASHSISLEAAVRSDQKRALQILQSRFAQDTYPHALLFVGQQGVGKRWTALALAMAVCCPNNTNLNGDVDPIVNSEHLFGACGQCRSCHNAAAYQHPDLVCIKPHNGTIRIGVVRDLLAQLALKPLESDRRVVILEAAETLTASAANALLKILEEPPAGTIFILTTFNHRQLLTTVKSRCQQVSFNDLDWRTLEDYASSTLNLPSSLAATASAMAFGSLDRLQVRGQANWLEGRRQVIQGFLQLPQATVGECLGFAQQVSKDRNTFDAALDVLTTWFRDLLVHKLGIKQYFHNDMADQIHLAASQTPRTLLLANLKYLTELRKRLGSNLNLKLAAEALVLRLTHNQRSTVGSA